MFMREQGKAWKQRARLQAEAAGHIIVSDLNRKPFEVAMAPLYDRARRDPRLRDLVDRLRQVQ
jgi:hypothetical protein